jgi:hypothetical protein
MLHTLPGPSPIVLIRIYIRAFKFKFSTATTIQVVRMPFGFEADEARAVGTKAKGMGGAIG